jgi:hypothetical protein
MYQGFFYGYSLTLKINNQTFKIEGAQIRRKTESQTIPLHGPYGVRMIMETGFFIKKFSDRREAGKALQVYESKGKSQRPFERVCCG